MKNCFFFTFLCIVLNLKAQQQFNFKTVTSDDGLSQNSVISIAQDQNGFMWFATQDGLSQYNGIDYKIKDYVFEDITRKDYVRLGKIFVDSKNNLWIAPLNKPLLKESDENLKSFQEIRETSTIIEIDNTIWVGTYENGLFKIQEDKVQKLSTSITEKAIYNIIALTKDILLICTEDALYKYFIKENKLKKIGTPNKYSCILKGKTNLFAATFDGKLFTIKKDTIEQINLTNFTGKKLNKPTIYDLEEDDNGRLWIGTFKQGVYLIDWKSEKIHNFLSSKFNTRGLSYNYTLDIFKDKNGVIWIGTDGGGVSYYDKEANKFNVLTNQDLPNNNYVDLVRSISVNNKGTIWIGTSGKGLTKYSPVTNKAKTYPILDNKRILSLLHDNQGNFWLGAFQAGLHLIEDDGNSKQIRISDSIANSNQITVNWIKEIEHNTILFGTFDHGIFLYNKEKGLLKNFHKSNTPNMETNLVSCAYPLDKSIFLIGMGNNEVLTLNLKSNTIQKKINAEQLDYSPIKSLYYDGRSVFVGTTNGLYTFENQKVNHFNSTNGLPNKVIYAIVPDHQNNLWVSTNKGIAKLSGIYKENLTITSFTKEDGLQGNEFNTGAFYQGKDGQIYFGGIDGINWFDPIKIPKNTTVPKTNITNFLFTENKNKAPVKLKYNQNDLTIQFSSSVITLANKNQYKYRLIGVDDTWKNIGNLNTIDFINLSPGNYDFQVIGSNYDGVWSNKPASIQFKVLHPWHQSSLAYFIYATIGMLVLYLLFKIQKKRLNTKSQIDTLRQIDKTKSKLYSEISHELKTPLTLIKGNTHYLQQKHSLSTEEKKALNSTENNTNQILNLVNQMLDLTSIDAKQFQLDYHNYNMVDVIKFTTETFESLAKSKNITIYFSSDVDELWMQVDIQNIRKIINNLLSNAIKFTPKNGKITVQISFEKNKTVNIGVLDTGKGISPEHLTRIFDRHYRTFDLDNNLGNGIGMALCKELVELMKGSISVSSEVGKGSFFKITLPFIKGVGKRKSFLRQYSSQTLFIPNEFNEKYNPTQKQYDLVIVEDNLEMQAYYKMLLSSEYNLTFFDNGKDAIKKIQSTSVDFILSDIIMPKMNGYQFCDIIKKDWKTSHIPFIIVSGKSLTTDKQKGYKMGVDAYLTKPFNDKELLVVIENLLHKQKENAAYFKRYFAIEKNITDSQPNINPKDLEFIEKLNTLILAKKELLNVEFLTKEMAMSRSQLHRKVKKLTEMSTTEYINHIRIEKSKNLLMEDIMTITEIAFEIGFTDPSYFGKTFKKITGTTPLSYRKNAQTPSK